MNIFHKSGVFFKKHITIIKADPLFFVLCLLSYGYIFYLRIRKGITLDAGLILKGIPHVEITNGGQIFLGKNVTLYSTWRRYFAHFTAPVRLFAEDGGVIQVGDNTRINGSTIHARKKIVIGYNCLIAANTSIIDSNGHDLCMGGAELRIKSKDIPEKIIIGNNVWIGLNCIILKNVTIGNNSVVGAGSVVINDIAPNSLVCGNPAKVIKKYPIIRDESGD